MASVCGDKIWFGGNNSNALNIMGLKGSDTLAYGKFHGYPVAWLKKDTKMRNYNDMSLVQLVFKYSEVYKICVWYYNVLQSRLAVYNKRVGKSRVLH